MPSFRPIIFYIKLFCRYLLAVNEAKSSIPEKWLQQLNVMQRNSSSTLEAFLIPSDDPRTRKVYNILSAAAMAKRAKGNFAGVLSSLLTMP